MRRTGKGGYINGWAPYHAILQRLILPPRKPQGHPGNHKRALAVMAALHQEKVRRGHKCPLRSCTLCKFKVNLKGLVN